MVAAPCETQSWFNTAHLARFVLIVRTYVPFVAGVIGALLWVVSLCLLGYWFGNQPMVKNNLTAVILLIVAISASPGVIAWLRSRRQPRVAPPL